MRRLLIFVRRFVLPFVIFVASAGFLLLAGSAFRSYCASDESALIQAVVGAVVCSTLGLGALQFYSNSEWRRKHSVFTEVLGLIREITRIRSELDDMGVPLAEHIDNNKPITGATAQEWVNQATQDGDQISRKLCFIINELEVLAMGVLSGVYHEELTKRLVGTLVERYWEVLQAFVRDERGKCGWEDFGREIAALYLLWQPQPSREDT